MPPVNVSRYVEMRASSQKRRRFCWLRWKYGLARLQASGTRTRNRIASAWQLV